MITLDKFPFHTFTIEEKMTCRRVSKAWKRYFEQDNFWVHELAYLGVDLRKKTPYHTLICNIRFGSLDERKFTWTVSNVAWTSILGLLKLPHIPWFFTRDCMWNYTLFDVYQEARQSFNCLYDISDAYTGLSDKEKFRILRLPLLDRRLPYHKARRLEDIHIPQMPFPVMRGQIVNSDNTAVPFIAVKESHTIRILKFADYIASASG